MNWELGLRCLISYGECIIPGGALGLSRRPSATLSLEPNGSVTHTTNNPNGSQTVVVTGHDVLIFFPTDVPAGPSTTLYVGKVVYTVDADFVFTLEGSSGPKRDICAELS